MKGVNLSKKIILGGILIVAFSMIISTIIIAVVVRKQNQEEALRKLEQAYVVIRDDINKHKEDVLDQTVKLASREEIGGQVEYLRDAKSSGAAGLTMDGMYRELVRTSYEAARMGNLWKTSIYDLDGDLVVFAVIEDGIAQIGFPSRTSAGVKFKIASLKKGDQEITADSWKPVDRLPGGVALVRKVTKIANGTAQLEANNGLMTVVSYEQVWGKDYINDGDDVKVKKVPVGFIRSVKIIEQSMIKRLSLLTGTEISLFVKERLGTGAKPDHYVLDSKLITKFKDEAEKSSTEQDVEMGEREVAGENLFEGILPLYGDGKWIGAISALYSKKVSRENTSQMIKILSLVSLICVLLVLPITLLFSRSIVKPINRIEERLEDASDQVASASAQVSSASQSLAEGSAGQAASIEETSSSLEEMSSMTKQNANNALQANNLTKEVSREVGDANKSMSELSNSMEGISKANEETQKIIKTIDEIAFQTNLLALNAAVEAARAGEAGAGFAVVAEEVRNLALRSADAAKSTAELIDGTVKKVNEGTGLVAETNEAFTKVEKSSSKVAELVDAIAAASNEQALGIEEVNRAVAEMDKVTQQNAANAEESAAASEEMSAQAEQMKGIVLDLTTIVGGSGNRSGIGHVDIHTETAPAMRRQR